jgi:hypothetical protein
MKPSQRDQTTIHPSFLALDRAHLGHGSTDVLAHLDGCEECRRHFELLANPGTTSGFASVQQAIAKQRGFPFAWVWGSVSLAAVACSLFLFVGRHQPDAGRGEEVYLGSKGFLSVWIYVKRGSETELWDGKKPLASGDRVRLKVDPGKYHRVEVYSVSTDRNPTQIYAGAATPGQSMTLPDAWEVDDSPAAERLFVVFGDAPIQPDWDDWLQGKARPGVAVLPFILPKSSAAGSDAGRLSP